jgi:predicted TPR repeat methyltransferase
MLDKSDERGCYSKLVRANLLEALPFGENLFDMIVSTAVTTYLGE